ncbi:dna repair protein rad51 [Diplodia corticola]|uniref:Dna repair protein rad51 n=1 Tax=Diplodia corticola TaxID=236234 RepID=A0A1J9RUF8_9PEZI|nr:dna repair protein rad51 [Diplodia corticola]OJD32063.1 dna repair protein rad51 [Diplodia corticola]
MDMLSTIQPILASSLLAQIPEEGGGQLPRTGCGTREIDDALRGGLDLGVGGVACISGEKGIGKTALAFAFLTTHLLSQPANQAVVIDTTGTFDVLRLYNSILSRIRADPSPAAEDQEAVAEETLGKVKIMRVFDFLGMIEAVSEVRETLENQRHHQESRQENPLQEPARPKEQVPAKDQETRKPQRIRSTIPDSEDESEDDDDAMLLDQDEEPTEDERTEEMPEDGNGRKEEAEDGRVGMIVVDNITHAVSPMMKTNYAQASALLTSFLRSLSQLTRTHKLITVLVNAVTTVPKPPPSATDSPQHTQAPIKNPCPSIFASAGHIMPALSPILPAQADFHLLITSQPLTRQDAVTLHSFSNNPSSHANGSRLDRASVMEVLNDRYGDRVGRWAAFASDASGLIVGVDPERGVPPKQYRLPGFASKMVL